MEQYGVRHVADGAAGGIADAALGLIAENTLADTFYLYDLGEVSIDVDAHSAYAIGGIATALLYATPQQMSPTAP
jgi:hypothetical protein